MLSDGICGPHGGPVTPSDLRVEGWKIRGISREEIEEMMIIDPPVSLAAESEELKWEMKLRMMPPLLLGNRVQYYRSNSQSQPCKEPHP